MEVAVFKSILWWMCSPSVETLELHAEHTNISTCLESPASGLAKLCIYNGHKYVRVNWFSKDHYGESLSGIIAKAILRLGVKAKLHGQHQSRWETECTVRWYHVREVIANV